MIYQTAILYLSTGGESFDIRNDLSFQETDVKNDPVHPRLKEAQNCKTHETVLAFLESIQDDPSFASYTHLYHNHNPKYEGHSNIKGVAHPDDVHKMIAFVKQRIEEKKSLHVVFDKLGKGLGRTLALLDKGSAYPIVGTIPAVVKIAIGALQIIFGLLLSLLGALPAICSKTARILCQRSIKHVGHGFCNAGMGILQSIPLLGTLIYKKLL